ncbi:transposase [Streptomyces sp. NPDC001743]|uniref:transposase n=1 Tax=Streptomyces sp. NPDC001743 TaxID=3154397 RepID=UPI00332DEDD6
MPVDQGRGFRAAALSHLREGGPPRAGPLKGVSSRYLRQEYTGTMNQAIACGRLRAPSYFAGSCSGAPLQIVKDYIENQKRPD